MAGKATSQVTMIGIDIAKPAQRELDAKLFDN